jgi:hypothetical protein
VGQVAKFSQNSGVQNWKAVKKIIRYIASTPFYGIPYSQENGEMVAGYTNADHGGDLDDRTSTVGCVFLCSSGSISWLKTTTVE